MNQKIRLHKRLLNSEQLKKKVREFIDESKLDYIKNEVMKLKSTYSVSEDLWFYHAAATH
jgi:hypothetical protein